MKEDKKILKESKGITLIALIITIIVLLILVLVTINVALNGKLFENANKGTKDTEREMIGEQIIGAMEINDYGDIDAKKTFDNVQNKLFPGKVPESSIKWNKDNTEVEFDVTGKKGTYRYKITGTGITKIEDENPEPKPDSEEIFINKEGEPVDKDGNILKDIELGDWIYSWINEEHDWYCLFYIGKDINVNLPSTVTAKMVEWYNVGNDKYYLKVIKDDEEITTEGKMFYFNEYNKNSTNIKSINLNNIKTSEIVGAFKGLTSLESVTGLAGIDRIQDYSFENCNSLTYLEFSETGEGIEKEGLQSIGANAFNGSSIETIRLPSTINNINEDAFNNCTNLTSIIINKTEAECSDTNHFQPNWNKGVPVTYKDS